MSSEFDGDLDTSTVNLSLEKFLEVVNENVELKSQINDYNPWMRWIHLAHMIDSYRVFPRLFFGAYIILLLMSSSWFMALAAPTATQAGFVGTIIGAGAAWFGLYVNSGWKHNKGN